MPSNHINGGLTVNKTTYDCFCGLQIVKTCPRAVALQKRLHLSKNESCRLQHEEQKATQLADEFKYVEKSYNRCGKLLTNFTIYTNESWVGPSIK
mgnify:FL=1